MQLIHYQDGFPVLIMNNTATKWYEYVRCVLSHTI